MRVGRDVKAEHLRCFEDNVSVVGVDRVAAMVVDWPAQMHHFFDLRQEADVDAVGFARWVAGLGRVQRRMVVQRQRRFRSRLFHIQALMPRKAQDVGQKIRRVQVFGHWNKNFFSFRWLV